MLKCASREEQLEMIVKIKTFLNGKDKGGTNEFNIRYTDVVIDGLDEKVEVDVTSEKKALEIDYSSDMSVRDRLNTIQRKYGDKGLKTVVDNIIVAKKVLKEKGIYKKSGSIGSTECGGFGGIGVENWILQNGGSFVKAMQTFLENTVDENGNEISFKQFKKNYPIYDFGQNHRDDKKGNDHYIEGLTPVGFSKAKTCFKEILKEYQAKEKDESEEFFDSIIEYTKEANEYKMSDMSQINSLLANMRTYKENNAREEL